MDYGQVQVRAEEEEAGKKARAHAATLKEVKLRPRTDEHDLDFKLKNARRFLIEGDKVKVTVMFRGREMVHRAIGREQLDRVKEMLGTIAAVENPPRMDGRFLSMILVPNREAIAKLERRARGGGGGAWPRRSGAAGRRAGRDGARERRRTPRPSGERSARRER